MKSMWKLLFITAFISISGTFYYQKYVKDPVKQMSMVSVDADQLFSAFETDENVATKRFGDKWIEVSGVVRSINNEQNGETSITLNVHSERLGVVCWMNKNTGSEIGYSVGDEVKLKGFCKGMMMDVIVAECLPLKE